MDDLVCNKLREWGLSDYIQTFKDQEINKSTFYKLDDECIKELFPKAGPRTLFKDKLKAETQGRPLTLTGPKKETVTSTVEVLPSTNSANGTKKRTQEPQGTSPAVKRQRLQTASERKALSDVKAIMESIKVKVQSGQKTPFTDFLKNKIEDLETGKREQIGVFGRTGSGKSSLINAIIGEKGLLPSGSVSACTSVMFKLEANNASPKYEAEIEFIQKEEWKDDLWLGKNFGGEEHTDTAEKLTALYGEDWKVQSVEELMDDRYFREIKEFLESRKKILKYDTARELSARFIKYISDSSEVEGKRSRQYWPLVKCVTIKVPKQDLLQHVTLVDLPGNGDRNNSRDQMWKTVVGSCSTVWVVADINRAVAEKEPWEILENASSLLGNGGECQKIVFICTKSDNIDDPDDQSASPICERLLKRNEEAKRKVMAEFKKQRFLRKHFTDDCFEVFTVSSKEFLKKKHLNPADTEIPKLQELVQNLNASHSETLGYVTGAHGILALIHGARQETSDHKIKASRDLKENLDRKITECYNKLKQTYDTFDQCLTEGVEKAKDQCEKSLKKILHPRGVKGGAFHKSLQYAVRNNGVFKAKKGSKTKNINMELSSPLTESIDEDFKKNFPNQHEQGPFQGAIDSFSLGTEELMEKYKDVILQLSYLKTEEDKIKAKLYKIIRDGKKTIYSTLTKTIEENMQKCYKDAADIAGPGSMEFIRFSIETYVWDKKTTMFQTAKDNMLEELKKLLILVLERLKQTLTESIDVSFLMDASSLPDVTGELKMVKNRKDKLESSAKPN